MVFFASQLRSFFSPQRSIDRPRPLPFCRRDQPPRLSNNSAASPPRHDVIPSSPIPTRTNNPRVAQLPAMTACKFYQQGNCKFGNSCRFEHIARNQPQSNRFGALAPQSTSAGGAGAQNHSSLAKYNISADVITKDLTVEKPQWILSAYAPGRDAPDQLFGGYPREQSFEELRLHYMLGKASGNEQQALNQAQELYQNAQQQMENALRNAEEAAQFVIQGENRHPNRHDVCRDGTKGAPFGQFLVGRRSMPAANPFAPGAASAQSPFNQAAPSTSAFGQPSALGQRSNPFGTPAFAQPPQPVSAPFGQASVGQSSGGPSPFAQAAQPVSGFGQPSSLGAKPSPFGTPAFGQPAQPAQPAQQGAQGNAFGQPSQLGQKQNPFVAAANTGASTGGNTGFSSFAAVGAGNSSQPPATRPFGAPSSNQAQAAPSPFGSAAQNQSSAPFGSSAQPASAFGQPSAPTPNPFASVQQQPGQGAHNPFAPNTQSSANGMFGQPASPFAQNTAQKAADTSAQQGAGASRPTPFASAQTGQTPAAATSPYPPDSTRQHPPLESYTTKEMDGQLATFKGKPVTYKDGRPGIRAFDGSWTRIWFPNGPPAYSKDTELPVHQYDDKCKAQWATFAQTGAFADGVMPELPPLRECTRWDF